MTPFVSIRPCFARPALTPATLQPEAAPAQQPHYFFIQNPDGTRTQHFGIPPAEYQQACLLGSSSDARVVVDSVHPVGQSSHRFQVFVRYIPYHSPGVSKGNPLVQLVPLPLVKGPSWCWSVMILCGYNHSFEMINHHAAGMILQNAC